LVSVVARIDPAISNRWHPATCHAIICCLAVTEEAARCEALAEVSDSTRAAQEKAYQDLIAELQHELKAAQDEAERLRNRGFWSRLSGVNG